jgi:RNA polymerase sigma-70 factor (ECF subfamily)
LEGCQRRARQERGRFRGFLLTAVRHFLSNERDAARAQKRGGAAVHLPLEYDDGERRYLLEPVDDLTPELVYERRWAQTVLDSARARLGRRYAAPDRQKTFNALRPLLMGRDEDDRARAAAALGVSDGALRVALHRLRGHYAASLREVVAETVDDDDVDEELQALLKVVSR